MEEGLFDNIGAAGAKRVPSRPDSRALIGRNDDKGPIRQVDIMWGTDTQVTDLNFAGSWILASPPAAASSEN